MIPLGVVELRVLSIAGAAAVEALETDIESSFAILMRRLALARGAT
jgi:hypothetical protein